MSKIPLQYKHADEVLKYIVEYHKENLIMPTMREIAKGVGIKSDSTVCYIMKYLEREGYIRTLPGKSRAIIVLEETWHGGAKISKKTNNISK